MKGGITQDAVTAAGLLSEATTVITTAVSSTWSIITGNPLTKLFVGAAILGVGFRFLRKAKRVSH